MLCTMLCTVMYTCFNWYEPPMASLIGKCLTIASQWLENCVGPRLTEFWIDRMAFGQPERTCLNIQNAPLL